MTLYKMREMTRGGFAVAAAVGCLLALSGTAASGQWEQLHKLTADDGASADLFGMSTSVSGNIIVVAAQGDDDAGSYSGSAYVFDATTGEQLHKLTADDAAADDYFGSSVSISGNTIVVGAVGDNHAGIFSGSAYVFDATTGEQLHKLTADDAEEDHGFGGSVSISGNTIVVGAKGDNHAGSASGSAYVFDATTGEQLHKLTANDGAAYDTFGGEVSVSGDITIIGAKGDDDAGTSSGSAYIFDASTGEQIHRLTADDAAEGDWFGNSVSISGSTIVVGAHRDDDAGSKSGSAYVFDATTGLQVHKLTADDGAAGDYFGYSVSVDGNTIVVGAYYDDDAGSNSGSAYVLNATTGQQVHKLTADDGAAGDYFGGSVSVSQNTIVVGAHEDDHAAFNSGSAYVFLVLDSLCPADCTGPDGVPDGTVDVHDLLLVIARWGTGGPEGDITGPDSVPDGVVDVHDLLAILASWGPCE